MKRIKVTFPDGSVEEYDKGITPLDIAKQIGPRLARESVVAKVNDVLVDIDTPLDKDCTLELITVDKKEALSVLWHSCSHVMAAAVKQLFPKAKLGIGPPIEEGFYYDFDVDRPFTPDDLKRIEEKMNEIIGSKARFRREELSKKDALKLFANEPFKLELIRELPGDKVSVYYTDSFVDLCRGPHVPHAGFIKAFKLLRTSGAYWRGSEKNKMLQRIYGIAFPKQETLDEFLKRVEEAERRSHLKLGKQLDLFSIHDEAPGFIFIHHNGMVIWNELINFWMREHLKRGYQIVNTPLIMKKRLWVQSGHWDHYRENMYFTQIDEEEYAVKPMNCPGAILIYKEKRHSYRDLPIKIAELGVVHRHERSGVLNGLFRTRKFTQDDAHIFCTEQQVEQQVIEVMELVDYVYKKVGFSDYHVELSTRPEKSMGTDEQWERAERALANAIERKHMAYKINEGEGAFYGPKIDFHIKDCLGRTWQCATVQLDFSMPEKFDLYYIGPDDKKHRPVMIHRVIYGSMERFLGVLIEHYAGAFPFWLSPIQVTVINVADRHADYAKRIVGRLLDRQFRAKLDARDASVSKRVRDAQLQRVPYTVVVGDKEQQQNSVTVRARNNELFSMTFDEFIAKLEKERLEMK
jgi:threonyl-tRNA synthetase